MKARWIKATGIKSAEKELEKEGHSIILKAVEIGAWGSIAGTLYQFLSQIGIKGRNRAKCLKRLIV